MLHAALAGEPTRRESKTLFVPKNAAKFWKAFNPERMEGESHEAYRQRRKQQTGVLKWMKKRAFQETTTTKGKQAQRAILSGSSGSNATPRQYGMYLMR